jgi:glycosyltransferase involved in cell wall biosynthesis
LSKSRISVALCTYNGARFLPQQLDSISQQTRLPDELIVCDDRSTDDSVEIIEAFARRADYPVRIEINQSTLGSIKNFEKAISRCQGGIISLADQDDLWKPRKLAVLEQTLEDHPEAGYVFSDAELIDEAGASLGISLWESARITESVYRHFSTCEQVRTLLRRNLVTGATMAFRSSFKSILLPISKYCVHDCWIAFLASALGWCGVPVSERLILYRQHSGQQIGARRMSLLNKIRWCRQVGPAEYNNRTQIYLDFKERLLAAEREGRTYPASHMLLLEGKIAHCSQRAAAHAVPVGAKVGKVFAEVLTGRYSRYSNSWQSVVEDLCF